MAKEKRQMTGYNCYIKKCAKESGDFKTCLTDKGWAKLSDKEKSKFNDMAKEQCDI